MINPTILNEIGYKLADGGQLFFLPLYSIDPETVNTEDWNAVVESRFLREGKTVQVKTSVVGNNLFVEWKSRPEVNDVAPKIANSEEIIWFEATTEDGWQWAESYSISEFQEKVADWHTTSNGGVLKLERVSQRIDYHEKIRSPFKED